MLLNRRWAARGRPRPRRPAVAVVIAALLVAACGTTGPSGSASPFASGPSGNPPSAGPSSAPTPTVDAATIYATIEDQVIAIRGLQPKAPVEPKVLDDAGIKKLVADSFEKENPKDVVAANERLLKAFDLLPEDASLSKLYVDLLGSQVAGLYRPTDKTLYVVSRSGGLGPAEKTTFAHEFTHALQDQNFDLGALKLDEVGSGDRSLGRLALVEGDAVLAQSAWQTQHLSQAELIQLLAQSANDPSSAQLLAMPPILRDSLLFPYTSGLSFVSTLQADGWAAVNKAYAAPPASTEQILHPDKYAAAEAPIGVELLTDLAARLGAGWKLALEDSFGEFQFGVWLRGNTTVGAGVANEAAAGWGGDRVAVLDGPGGSWGVVLRTVWDSVADAAQFEAAATPLVHGLDTPAALLPGAGGPERWIVIGSDGATLNVLSGALGLAG
jgi:hypothetical protein